MTIRSHIRRIASMTAAVLVIAILIFVVRFGTGFVSRLRRRRSFFLHRRMDDHSGNVEINNPMFGHGAEDFEDDMEVSELTDSAFSIEVDEKVSLRESSFISKLVTFIVFVDRAPTSQILCMTSRMLSPKKSEHFWTTIKM